jgi:putative tricarboxylic transport membrane protein
MRRDAVSGVFWLVVAAIAIVHGVSLKLGTLHQPGPGFFPFWGGVVLALLAGTLAVTAQRVRVAAALAGVEWPKLLVVLAATLGYVVLLEAVGFGTVTFLFLVLLFRLERKTWRFSAAAGLAGAVASHALFQLWLKTQLPVGPLGF